MCIGVPMEVREEGGGFAWCEGRGERRQVDMALVGEQARGAWVLVHNGVAREVLTARRARQVDQALDALAAAMWGEQVTGLFPDLEDREPTLPPHLAAQTGGPR